MIGKLALLALIGASSIYTADAQKARVNATSAIEVFNIVDCAECTADKNSIFCTNAKEDSNYVKNATYKVTIRDKKARFGAADGSKYCWTGTFGKLIEPIGHFDSKLGEANITAYLDCSDQDLYYRQCIINAQLAIILMTIGSIVFLCGCTCCCFYCGCCKCLNNKGDDSRWGMCNRFCPSAPCADPPEKEEALPENIYNPNTEEENLVSLFGKNNKLNEVNKLKASLSDLKKPGSPRPGNDFQTSNPLQKGSYV